MSRRSLSDMSKQMSQHLSKFISEHQLHDTVFLSALFSPKFNTKMKTIRSVKILMKHVLLLTAIIKWMVITQESNDQQVGLTGGFDSKMAKEEH